MFYHAWNWSDDTGARVYYSSHWLTMHRAEYYPKGESKARSRRVSTG